MLTGWIIERSVSLILRLSWGLSLCVPSMREVGAQSEKVSVCRIFPSDSCSIRPSFHPSGDLGEEEELLLRSGPLSGEGLVYESK